MAVWLERVRRAQVYETAKAARIERARQQAALAPQESPEERDARGFERAREILKHFHVQEALVSVRDEVWHEGKIEERTDSGNVYSLMLCLHTEFDGLRLSGDSTEDEHLAIVKLPTTISIMVGSIDRAHPHLDLREDRDYDFTHFAYQLQAPVSEIMDTHGLHDGLTQVVNTFRHYGLYYDSEYPQVRDLDSPAATDVFNANLVHIVEGQRSHSHTLPSDLRKGAGAIIDQFPPLLREQGYMTASQLRSWVGTRVK